MEQGDGAKILRRWNREDSIRFSPFLYRDHYADEQFFNKTRYSGRTATRHDKLGLTFLAMVKRAATRPRLRAYQSRVS